MIDYSVNLPLNWKEQLATKGHFMDTLALQDALYKATLSCDYEFIDSAFKELTHKEGNLFKYLSQFENFQSIEFILSLRDSENSWEEDGIWHDDGSRKLAFSLSLTKNSHLIEGGLLEIRKKDELESLKIPPFEFGEIVVFKTGTSGFEHKINQVTLGKRFIIAGWCS